MKLLYMLSLIAMPILIKGQNLIIEEGIGVGPLKIGQTYDDAVKILGFGGELKTYDDYLAEILFNEDPKNALECTIGFDYYIRYEHLLVLPISFVFFKDNKVNQIKVSSFPEYYFAIARDTQTKSGLNFWAEDKNVIDLYGKPSLEVNYEAFILESYFYFEEGITLNFREDIYRSAHIYEKLKPSSIESFRKAF